MLLSDTYIIIKQVILLSTTHSLSNTSYYYRHFNLLFLHLIYYYCYPTAQPSLIVAQLVERSLTTHYCPGSTPCQEKNFLAFFEVFKDGGDLEYCNRLMAAYIALREKVFSG